MIYNENFQKVYLHIPYLDRKKALELGCLWDQKFKKWYISNQNNKKFKLCISLWNKKQPFTIIRGKIHLIQFSE